MCGARFRYAHTGGKCSNELKRSILQIDGPPSWAHCNGGPQGWELAIAVSDLAAHSSFGVCLGVPHSKLHETYDHTSRVMIIMKCCLEVILGSLGCWVGMKASTSEPLGLNHVLDGNARSAALLDDGRSCHSSCRCAEGRLPAVC